MVPALRSYAFLHAPVARKSPYMSMDSFLFSLRKSSTIFYKFFTANNTKFNINKAVNT